MMWLEAALAFALIMLVFATMVTTITEMILRALNSREAHFRLMMEDLYAKVIRPQVEAKLGAIDASAFADLITTDPTDRPLPGGWRPSTLLDRFLVWAKLSRPWQKTYLYPLVDALPVYGMRLLDWLRGRFIPRQATQMTAMDFMERLGSTEIGRAIHAEGQQRVNDVINDLAQKYERFCAGTRARFAAKTQIWGVLIAVILAFGLNVDAVRVFNAFLGDAKLRGAVIEKQAEIQARATAAEQKLAETLKQIENQNQTTLSDQAARAEFDRQVTQAKDLVADFGKQNQELAGLGIPVGRHLYPYCEKVGNTKEDALCSQISGTACTDTTSPRRIADLPLWLRNWIPAAYCSKSESQGPLKSWFLSTLLAGLLIGLGAPFWFDLAQGLSKSLQLLRALKPGGKSDDEKSQKQKPDVAGAPPPPRNEVEAFKTAVAANVAVAAAAASRPIFSADGRVL